ncbi:PREDICTED: U11/U12 small nuclear ribonucleoprotein 35 kDa protein-like [Priapulus caudatus]|uniref:U11/U12 small nuclear ribonucleoprotein 35 kDa protein-like n=1 Tax=Priapulus caudatus TaxID=37621 RepID=A0ABM1ESI7_PRICU|nr:PREDICTED: U11/U12 small nuclear ribonucleoprotein 35 kDa protein-like [Priapulus caudatus]
MGTESAWSPIATVYDPLRAGSIDGTDELAHDRAVQRALSVKYVAPRHAPSEPRRTVFVGRLSGITDEGALLDAFSHHGAVARCHLVRDLVTGASRRYAFVEFERERDAERATRDANKTIIDDAELLVTMECERALPGWVPRRLGGGFGGRKESGQLRFGGADRPFKKPIQMLRQRLEDGSTRHGRGSDHRGANRESGVRGGSGEGMQERYGRNGDMHRRYGRERSAHDVERSPRERHRDRDHFTSNSHSYK